MKRTDIKQRDVFIRRTGAANFKSIVSEIFGDIDFSVIVKCNG